MSRAVILPYHVQASTFFQPYGLHTVRLNNRVMEKMPNGRLNEVLNSTCDLGACFINRSGVKLAQIVVECDEAVGVLMSEGCRFLNLGAVPGGFSSVLIKAAPHANITAVSKEGEISRDPRLGESVKWLTSDIMELDAGILNGPFNLVVADAATSSSYADPRLFEREVDLAKSVLATSGVMIIKSSNLLRDDYLVTLPHFSYLYVIKPEASRSTNTECYHVLNGHREGPCIADSVEKIRLDLQSIRVNYLKELATYLRADSSVDARLSVQKLTEVLEALRYRLTHMKS